MMGPDNLAPRRRSDAIRHVPASGSPPTTTFAAAEILARRSLRGVIEHLERPRLTGGGGGALQGRQRHRALVGTLVPRPARSARLSTSQSSREHVLVHHRFLRRATHVQPLVPRPDLFQSIRTNVSLR